MTKTRKKLIAGNWKMNGTLASAAGLAVALGEGLEKEPALLEACDFAVCPPFVHLLAVRQQLPVGVALGAQDCALNREGAYTGDISVNMLVDVECDYVILGHSERRQYHGETDGQVAAKAALCYEKNLTAIICVGETEVQRAEGCQEEVVGEQLARAVPPTATAGNTVIAYEPVWAIGTGKTASPEDVKAMHSFIRRHLKEQLAEGGNMRILYGGSVKPDNAEVLMSTENVDGALVGGASLKADQFLAIARGVK
ncbi:MAG: triose-phosphate isomerase [Micavibrio aeruginosavorus]|uniref:Triosephosphate isomerase n=1 Tax=Micavibrio aeruginosavorus TaxID=349221 RepID=A0A7T5UH88_9BACT|nr:MAG: triose-phosphate isomerase [Micavibrio aeruginosavorus]